MKTPLLPRVFSILGPALFAGAVISSLTTAHGQQGDLIRTPGTLTVINDSTRALKNSTAAAATDSSSSVATDSSAAHIAVNNEPTVIRTPRRAIALMPRSTVEGISALPPPSQIQIPISGKPAITPNPLPGSAQDTLYLSYYARIFQFPTTGSKILGMIGDTGTFTVRQQQGDWYSIDFGNTEGWVRSSDVLVIRKSREATGATSLTDDFIHSKALRAHSIEALQEVGSGLTYLSVLFQESLHQSSNRILLIITLLFLIGIGFLILQRFRKGRTGNLKREIGEITTAERKVLLVCRQEKTIPQALTEATVTISDSFAQAGYRISKLADPSDLANALAVGRPTVIVIDFDLGTDIVATVEKLLLRRVTFVTVPIIFYNTPDPDSFPRSAILSHMVALGTSFTDWDLIQALSQMVALRDESTVQHKSIAFTILQGSVKGDRLGELFMFLENSRKTGCVLIESGEKPFGMVYFDNGRVIDARTALFRQTDAVMAALDLKQGGFKFIIDKKPAVADCNLSATGILLAHTKRVDETTHLAAVAERRKKTR